MKRNICVNCGVECKDTFCSDKCFEEGNKNAKTICLYCGEETKKSIFCSNECCDKAHLRGLR